jgi:D-serine dehydratase
MGSQVSVSMTRSAEIEDRLRTREPFLWINDEKRPSAAAFHANAVTLEDIRNAEQQWDRFGSLLATLFPELEGSRGLIESPLVEARSLQTTMTGDVSSGRWFFKCDHALPVAGSVKARGGVFEVLLHAEELALAHRIIKERDDRILLASHEARALFDEHRIGVGSTGNLGLSIGIMAAALGFQVTVHMSQDAKPWKIARLRDRGVEVVRHPGDFGAAVAAGRRRAQEERGSYFVDDENSLRLLLGYSVAALRLRRQLSGLGLTVDEAHPLLVYIPCGVGGAPGGITLGLRRLFGDGAHCFFAEPVASPCMLLRLAARRDESVSVGEIGLDNRTEADGLAAGRASELVARMVNRTCRESSRCLIRICSHTSIV